MTIQKGFAFPHPDPNNLPSSGDGGPDYDAIQPSNRLSTAGALGDETAHGDSSLAAWQANAHRPGLGVSITDAGAPGYGVGAHDSFSRTGEIPADSNLTSTTTAGGPLADSSFVRNSGGGDDAGLRDSNLGAGGRSIS